MKAAFIKAPFQVEWRDVPLPKLGARDVLVKIKACGICGTDIHSAVAWAKDWERFGHEAVGVVEDYGHEVKDLKNGDIVLIQSGVLCNTCPECQNGNIRSCTNTYSAWGTFCEYMAVKRQNLCKGKSLSPIGLTLAEPLSVAINIISVSDLGINQDVAILGPGPIGLFLVRLCRHMGMRKVFAVGTPKDRARLTLAKKLGANEVIILDSKTSIDKIISATQNIGVDRVLITAPPIALLDGIKAVKIGGTITMAGLASKEKDETVSLNAKELLFKRVKVIFFHGVPNLYFPKAAELLKDGVINPGDFITHTFKMKDLAQALKLVAKQEEGVIKAVVTI